MTESGPVPYGELDPSVIERTFTEVQDDYSQFYQPVMPIPLRIETSTECPTFQSDGYHKSISRGTYKITPGVYRNTETGQLTIDFSGRSIAYLSGNTAITNGECEPVEVAREILSHEFIHSQANPISLMQDPNGLSARDLRGDVQPSYVIGFKAVKIDFKSRSSIELTRRLEEFFTQYLSMAMRNGFKQPSDSIEFLRRTGLGMESNVIFGAEILHRALGRFEISPQEIESLHRNSDLKGLIDLLRGKNSKLAGIILEAGKNDPKKGLKILKDLDSI